jgi:hypothetical protein
MTPESTKEEGLLSADESMSTLGIRCVPVDYFHYRNYRYTNLKDAVAQARRDRLMPAGDDTLTGIHVAGQRSSSRR